MILAFDTYYFDTKAKTICVAFDNWTNEENFDVYSELTEIAGDYQSGQFYKRELPCILSLLKKNTFKNIEFIIIDGYVYLDDNEKFGLGGHLFDALGGKIPIIGVAKTNFATIDKNKQQILRGKSIKPLYITSIGMDVREAARLIEQMKGQNRIPDLLKKLDILTKEKN
ncbi:exodeoxyribonuclease-5/deoxyribonuclease V [Flexibacter flexilis DSM 6793]|uniref:Exodeoxyribonuclease-5/deoxyribonuclease V n=1 Tax=Flexibacter flexilis DSM 6793 TaxID=927664 RepID=A0A1I1I7T6_9BACT|nr:endonuclease V [Flexibacter flexilis]SFC32489.1 exodeoxyribonuclease-5/deoxyribonuclease V [Flexibacter flexilis DSM 6793]